MIGGVRDQGANDGLHIFQRRVIRRRDREIDHISAGSCDDHGAVSCSCIKGAAGGCGREGDGVITGHGSGAGERKLDGHIAGRRSLQGETELARRARLGGGRCVDEFNVWRIAGVAVIDCHRCNGVAAELVIGGTGTELQYHLFGRLTQIVPMRQDAHAGGS